LHNLCEFEGMACDAMDVREADLHEERYRDPLRREAELAEQRRRARLLNPAEEDEVEEEESNAAKVDASGRSHIWALAG